MKTWIHFHSLGILVSFKNVKDKILVNAHVHPTVPLRVPHEQMRESSSLTCGYVLNVPKPEMQFTNLLS